VQLCGVAAYDFIFVDASMAAKDRKGDVARLTNDIRRVIARHNHKTGPLIGLAPQAILENTPLRREMGMDDFLLKPLEKDRLYKIIAKWMKRTRNNSEPDEREAPPLRKLA